MPADAEVRRPHLAGDFQSSSDAAMVEPCGGSIGFAELKSLAERFHAPLLRYFRRRVSTSEDAEDLTQEVFARLMGRPALGVIEKIDGFLFVTAANLLKDHYRTHSRRKEVPLPRGFDVASSVPDPSKQTEDKAEIGFLLTAIRALPPKSRAVFVMHRFDEVPHTEIARKLGISVSMVEKHIAAAVRQLRKRLNDGVHD